MSLLNLNDLRRDQIYFVEKNQKTGVSELYSLDKFSPRTREDIRKVYLLGRYGSVPDLGMGDGLWPMGLNKHGYTPKKRNSNSRKRKKIIFIATEGKNKTEKLYFKKLNSAMICHIYAFQNKPQNRRKLLQKTGHFGQKVVNKSNDQSTFHLPRQS